MAAPLSDPLASPWKSPANHPDPVADTPPTTTWHVNKPRVAGDLQSTSTVTTSSSSSSSTSSPHPSNSPSPLPIAEEQPTTWHIDEFDDQVTVSRPTTPPAQQPPSIRTLPRCGVVNFRKDGDSLRWAPRVTQNTSGVSARIHNFEDAFSLEEFSSRALPVVWRSKGGNPRLSDATLPDRSNDPQIPARSAKSTPTSAAKPPPPPKRSAHPMEKRAKSIGHSQRSIVRSTSVKKAVVFAAEVGRPSFWSFLAHTSKYQRSRAKARLHSDANKRASNASRNLVHPHESEEEQVNFVAVARKPWVAFAGLKTAKNTRNGKATRRAPESSEKSSSLFQRLMSHLDRRNAKKHASHQAPKQPSADVDRMAFSRSNGSSDSDEKQTFADRPRQELRQSRRSEGYSSRRVVSALAGHVGRKELTRVTSQDDQYVTFITSFS